MPSGNVSDDWRLFLCKRVIPRSVRKDRVNVAGERARPTKTTIDRIDFGLTDRVFETTKLRRTTESGVCGNTRNQHETNTKPSYPAWFSPTHAGLSDAKRTDDVPGKWFVTPTRVSSPTTTEWLDEETVDVAVNADAVLADEPTSPTTVRRSARSRHNAGNGFVWLVAVCCISSESFSPTGVCGGMFLKAAMQRKLAWHHHSHHLVTSRRVNDHVTLAALCISVWISGQSMPISDIRFSPILQERVPITVKEIFPKTLAHPGKGSDSKFPSLSDRSDPWRSQRVINRHEHRWIEKCWSFSIIGDNAKLHSPRRRTVDLKHFILCVQTKPRAYSFIFPSDLIDKVNANYAHSYLGPLKTTL
jgi:hypothetical protein